MRFQGLGLHTGRESTALLRPGARGSGPGFVLGGSVVRAVDLSADGEARATRLTDPARGLHVSGIEHLMAALAGTGAWDVVVEVQGGEPPALDGSALPFAEAIAGASIPGSSTDALDIAGPVEVSVDGSRAVAVPAGCLVLEVAIEFDHPWIGRQEMSWSPAAGDFMRDIAPARTFGFLEEAGSLLRRGLARGADLGSALVLGQEGPLNPGGARFPDEPVRHKILDLLGDLALLGRPLNARITALRPSHALNLALVRALRARAARHSSPAAIP